MIYGCEKDAILKLESSFLQNFTNFLYLRAEILANDLVATEKASEEWKTKLLASCSEYVTTTQKEYDSKAGKTEIDELDMVSNNPMLYRVLACNTDFVFSCGKAPLNVASCATS